jgi:hypothetical protein
MYGWVRDPTALSLRGLIGSDAREACKKKIRFVGERREYFKYMWMIFHQIIINLRQKN